MMRVAMPLPAALRRSASTSLLWVTLSLQQISCAAPAAGPSDGGAVTPPLSDAGPADAGPHDAGTVDAGTFDAGPRPDAGGTGDSDHICSAGLTPGDGGTFAPIAGTWTRRDDVEALARGFGAEPFQAHTITTSLFPIDLNGDGRMDFVYNRLRTISRRILQRADGSFEAGGPFESGVSDCATAVDLDSDGFDDLVCTLPPTVLWGGPQGIDAAAPTLLPLDTGDPFSSPVMTTSAWDVDEDGRLDLLFGSFPGDVTIARNQGGRAFEDVTPKWNLQAPGLTWSIGFVDFDGDERSDIFVVADGAAKENRAFRALGPDADGEPRFERFSPMAQGCDRDHLFELGNLTPMGLTLSDLDHDGDFELYPSLAEPKVMLERNRRGFWANTMDRLNYPPITTTTGKFLVDWGARFWDADHDGHDELLVATGDDDGFRQMPNRGRSRLVFLQGAPGLRFEEAGPRLGLTAESDFMNLAQADWDGDGDLDLTAGAWADHPVVYENRLAPAAPHLLVRLRGTVSNPEGLGARLQMTGGGRVRHWAVGGTFAPRVSQPPVTDISLPPEPETATLSIAWPSGFTQRVDDVRGSTVSLVIREPEFLTIDPPSRAVAAGSAQPVVIRVRPVDPLGAPRIAPVTIGQLSERAVWAGPESVLPDGTVERRLLAPATPGSTVVVVTIDGKQVRIRPRIRFTP